MAEPQTQRPEGYYWVSPRAGQEPSDCRSVALWTGKDWLLCGCEEFFTDGNFEDIGPMITEPPRPRR